MPSQIAIELLHSNKHTMSIVKEELQGSYDEELVQKVLQNVCERFEVDTPNHLSVLAITSLWKAPMPLVAAAGAIGHLFSENRPEGAAIGAEALVALSDNTDLIAVYQIGARWMVENCVELEVDVHELMYIPPMVSKPNVVHKNDDSPYYTLEGESLILGDHRNHHEENICLDVINIQNRIKFYLDWEFINAHEEPKEHLENPEHYEKQATKVRGFLGNKHFYITNKVDTRGRLYTQGYHVNPQGTDWQKSVLSLTPEVCT